MLFLIKELSKYPISPDSYLQLCASRNSFFLITKSKLTKLKETDSLLSNSQETDLKSNENVLIYYQWYTLPVTGIHILPLQNTPSMSTKY